MKSYLFPKTIISILVALFMIFAPTAFAAEARDFDSNAIIYGGAYSKDELIKKINDGTGKSHQSGSDLTKLFDTLGMGAEHMKDNNVKEGKVFKNGNVIVDGKTVATNVESMGRQNMPDSRRDNRFSYPVYWRHPSVSFRSDSLDAFVYMNDDNTMAFAITKSCGNPVKGVGVKKKRVVKKFSLEIRKFNDKDGDNVRDENEEFLSGWTFKVKGPEGFSKTIVTNTSGSITLNDLREGEYTITETQQSGWTSTSGLTKTIQLKKNETILFGNKKKEVIPVVKVVEKPVEVEKVVEKPVETLPVSGPAEAVVGTVGTLGLVGSVWKYRKTRKALMSAFKKF